MGSLTLGRTLGGSLLDLIISGAARYYLDHETLEDDNTSAVRIPYAIWQVVDMHVKDVAQALVLIVELTQRVPDPGWVGSEDLERSWLDWLKSAFYGVEDGPIAELVIKELRDVHGIDYQNHYAERRQIVHERDKARDAIH